MVSFHLWAAIRTVKEKIGTWNGYARYSELDPTLTREEWATSVAQARAALANRVAEVTRPLNARPVGHEIQQYDSKRATGYMQQVEVYVRDRDTGIIESRHYAVKSDTLRSRAWVVSEAWSRYQGAIDKDPEGYPEDIVGVGYVDTYFMTPKR